MKVVLNSLQYLCVFIEFKNAFPLVNNPLRYTHAAACVFENKIKFSSHAEDTHVLFHTLA